MKTRKILVALAAVALVSSISVNTFAGQWKQNSSGWLYQEDNGTNPTNTWKWIDGKCYYFDANGIMLADTTTPDGFTVDGSGAWVVNGVVQTQATTANSGVNHSAGYDPARPLAGKIDEWNLRLPKKYIGEFQIVNSNVQAMLTGQMDQYYMPPVGYSTSAMGNQVYTSQEGYDRAILEEQALYEWFCNWLNGMDFENMSEMEKAQEIKRVLASASYDYSNSVTGSTDYNVLIKKVGICGHFAMTATSLAKALGLKTAVSGTGTHAVYYIQVDGVAYMGSNQVLELDFPTPDRVYFD